MESFETISATRLAELDRQGKVELVDVRTPMEFQEIHASIARNVPLDTLDPQALMKQRQSTADDPLYLICKSGSRGAKACQKFIDAGFAGIVNVDGGTEAWAAAGLPVVRGKKGVSLERQVRIAAGFLVLLGVTLSLTVNQYFIGLSAFVGAGLLFAGLTDTCAMGMMLAKMPWNQSQEQCQLP